MKPSTIAAIMSGKIENILASESPGGIERQEKHGQQLIAATKLMPVDDVSRPLLEKLGFSFEPHDDLLYKATVPEGYIFVSTEHSYYTDVFDSKNRLRATIFYKAAFYDRRGEVTVYTRYSIRYGNRVFMVIDTISNTVLFESTEDSDCRHWLSVYYPEWQNHVSYWDTNSGCRHRFLIIFNAGIYEIRDTDTSLDMVFSAPLYQTCVDWLGVNYPM